MVKDISFTLLGPDSEAVRFIGHLSSDPLGEKLDQIQKVMRSDAVRGAYVTSVANRARKILGR